MTLSMVFANLPVLSVLLVRLRVRVVVPLLSSLLLRRPKAIMVMPAGFAIEVTGELVITV